MTVGYNTGNILARLNLDFHDDADPENEKAVDVDNVIVGRDSIFGQININLTKVEDVIGRHELGLLSGAGVFLDIIKSMFDENMTNTTNITIKCEYNGKTYSATTRTQTTNIQLTKTQ